MKNVNLLVFLTQLGICVVAPLVMYILLAIWLRDRFEWGSWIVILGVVLGVFSAARGLISTMKAMEGLSKGEKEEAPPVAFNDHD